MPACSVLEEILSRTEFKGANIYRAEEVARWPRAVFKCLVELGLFREIERTRTVECDNCMEGCVVEPDTCIDERTGKLTGYYLCRDEEYGGPVTFDEDEFRRWAFQLEALARLVADAIGLHGSVARVVAGRLYLLGTMPTGGGPLDVFLVGGVWLPDAPDVLGRADRLRSSAAAAVMVTRDPPPPELWPRPRPTVLSLAELATWNENDLSIDFTPLVKMLRSLRPPAPEDRWLTVTQAAQLAMKDFPHLDLRAAKVRVSRAATAGELPTNGKAGHARRIERVSFDAWRLEQRERDLDAEDK